MTNPEPKERKAREHGETWEQARRLYLKYPLASPADLADLLRVSRARFYACVEGLQVEREARYRDALASIKRKEGL
jgi:hypothetical protein